MVVSCHLSRYHPIFIVKFFILGLNETDFISWMKMNARGWE